MSIAVFIIFLSVTIFIAWKGGVKSDEQSTALSKNGLNKWFLGLSAGATANSGFVVTGAVALGYSYGFKWLLLPLGWFIGDLIFWKLFPKKLNQASQRLQVSSLSQILTFGISGVPNTIIRWLFVALILICLGGYTTAQWLAGQKILSGAFGISGFYTVLIFSLVVISYTILGGFRGSVYADTFQAIIRITGSLLALIGVTWLALENYDQLNVNYNNVDQYFFSPIGDMGILTAIAFVLGYSFASLGFGLGQPQITNRYLAGASPKETQAAKWIYIGYVQFTWVSMSLFGMLLRGVMPDIDDPEQGFILFFKTYFPSIIVGVILADIFSAMASTSNSLLITMSQTICSEIKTTNTKNIHKMMLAITLLLGIITMGLSLLINASVVSVALTSVSLLASGLAPSVIIKLFGWKHNGLSLIISIITGFIAALIWILTGNSAINESAPGIISGLMMNFLVIHIHKKSIPNEKLAIFR